CDQAANGKQTNYYTLLNNTIVHQTRVGGIDSDAGVITLADPGTVPGLGMYLEGNIIYDAEKLVRTQSTAQVTFSNCVFYAVQGPPWTGAGGGNTTNDPLFVHVPLLQETTNFTSWADAQIMWKWLSLRQGSPAIGAATDGRDLGAVIPAGPSIT